MHGPFRPIEIDFLRWIMNVVFGKRAGPGGPGKIRARVRVGTGTDFTGTRV